MPQKGPPNFDDSHTRLTPPRPVPAVKPQNATDNNSNISGTIPDTNAKGGLTKGTGSGLENKSGSASTGAYGGRTLVDSAELTQGIGESDAKLAIAVKSAALISALLVLVVAMLAAVGWAFGIEALKHPTTEPAIQGPASINLIILSIALLIMSLGKPRLWTNITGRTLAIIVALASLATFIEHTCHIQLPRLLQLTLWPESEDRGFGLTYPGPLLPHESFSFLLLALSTIFFNVALRQKYWPTQALAALVMVPNFIILSFYLMGQSNVCIYFGCVQLSPLSSLVLLLNGIALFFADPTVGAARIFSLKSTPGVLARRAAIGLMLLVAALLPRQWLIAAGESAGVVDASTINIVTAVVVVLTLSAFAWWCFRKIETEEVEKKEAIIQKDQAIVQKEEAIEQKDQAMELMLRESGAYEAKTYKLVCLTCMGEYTDMSLTHCPKDKAELISVLDEFRPGSTFAQVYLIIQELGKGGMSTVYLAEHLLMNKKVAVKVLQMRLASDPTTIQRFQREAQTSSSLSHANVVAVHDFNVTSSGQAYMVMEYLDGQSLSEFIERGKLMPWRETVLLLLEVCEGLEHAHAKGIIHRDLKPGNIMLLPSPALDRRFTPKIVDFGLAKILDDSAVHLTHTGEIFGSPLYMSPEQCQGLALDHRSDIYSLGCIMYAALVGKAPYHGENLMQTLMMHLQAPLPVMPPELGVPLWLQQIVSKAIAKDPAARFQTLAELSNALKAGGS
jgi:tRNA A-37 threonylcarbamoyl transferase component Bud32